jgi:uncharacterized protein (TIGR00288 family)
LNGNAGDRARNLAVFIDFENLASGFENRKDVAFDVRRVLDRLLEKGKVLVKVAYCDWNRFRQYTTPLHEAGIELIEIPKRSMTGKNSADIRLVVDAMDLSYGKEHIDTFVVVSGDSDFSPLVGKLKENGKYVIGLGMRESTSRLLAESCDEFIYYEDLRSDEEDEEEEEEDAGTGRDALANDARRIPAGKDEVYPLLFASVRALLREQDVVQSSMVKDTMKRKQPSFNEGRFGYRSFSHLLEEARDLGFLSLADDPRSGTYLVTKVNSPRRRRRGRRGRGKVANEA